MKRFTLPLLIICLFTIASYAQTVELSLISTAGGEFKTDNESLTFTVGEIVTETFTTTDLILTQGFLQPYAETVDIPQATDNEFSVSIYPNPASNYFIIDIISENNENYYIDIIDIKGKKINSKNLIEKSTKINISNYQPGTFFVRLINESNTFTKTYVLIKTGN